MQRDPTAPGLVQTLCGVPNYVEQIAAAGKISRFVHAHSS